MTAPATAKVESPTGEAAPTTHAASGEIHSPFTPPVTPLMKIEHPFDPPRESTLMPSERDLEQMMKIAEKLATSGFLPSRLNTPGKVLATIMTGRELGLPPMLSTRAIRIMKDTGLPIISADVLLGAFKRMGGRATFTILTDRAATLELRHPNGDQHVESFTMEDASRAGLLAKSGGTDDQGKKLDNNWQKYPKAMLRSRCITAGLKSVGWEPAAGMYDADEAEEIASGNGSAQTIRATVTADGQVEPTDGDAEVAAATPAAPPIIAIKGIPIDAMTEDGHFKLSEKALNASIKWAGGVIEQSKDAAEVDRMERFIAACQAEIKRRAAIETKFEDTKRENIKSLERDTKGIAQGDDDRKGFQDPFARDEASDMKP